MYVGNLKAKLMDWWLIRSLIDYKRIIIAFYIQLFLHSPRGGLSCEGKVFYLILYWDWHNSIVSVAFISILRENIIKISENFLRVRFNCWRFRGPVGWTNFAILLYKLESFNQPEMRLPVLGRSRINVWYENFIDIF